MHHEWQGNILMIRMTYKRWRHHPTGINLWDSEVSVFLCNDETCLPELFVRDVLRQWSCSSTNFYPYCKRPIWNQETCEWMMSCRLSCATISSHLMFIRLCDIWLECFGSLSMNCVILLHCVWLLIQSIHKMFFHCLVYAQYVKNSGEVGSGSGEMNSPTTY